MTTYDGFISYSHEADGSLAPAVQSAIQAMAKPWYRRRALHIFRDETGLSANPALWDSITAVLDDSAWLIVLASPQAAASPWVNREIEHWIERNGPDQILPVLTDGTWQWDDEAEDFSPSSTAVPPALRGAFTQEPRHIVMTWTRTQDELDPRDPRFRDQIAEIAAPIRGVSKEELTGADLREHRKTIRLVRATAALLVVLTLAAVVGAIMAAKQADHAESASHRAVRARDQAARARDESDFQRVLAQSHDLATTNRELSMLLAVESRHQRDIPQSRSALQSALVADPRYLSPVVTGATGGLASVCLGPDDKTAIVGVAPATLGFVDMRSGTIADRMKVPGADAKAGAYCAMSPGRHHGLALSSRQMWAFDPTAHRLVGRPWAVPSYINQAAISPDGRSVIVGTYDGKVLVGDSTSTTLRPLDSTSGAAGVAFAPDGKTAASTTRDHIVIWQTGTWTRLREISDPPADQGGGVLDLAEQSRAIDFAADGHTLCDSRRGGLHIFDLPEGSERWRRASEDVRGQGFVLAPDSRSLFLAGLGSSVLQFDLSTGATASEPFNTQDSALTGMAVSADSKTLVLTTASKPALQRWALDGRSAISTTMPAADVVPRMFSPDGSTLLTYPAGASLVVEPTAFEIDRGKQIGSAPLSAIPTLLSDRVVAGYYVKEGSADRYDLRTKSFTGPRFPLDITDVTQAAIDRSGRMVLGRGNGSLERYEPDGRQIGRPWHTLKGGSVDFIQFSPSGDAVVATNVGVATVVYPIRGASKAPRTIQTLFDPQFTADGSMIAGFTEGNQYRFVDWKTGRTVGEPIATDGGGYFSQHTRGDVFLIYSAAGGRIYDRRTRAQIGEVFPSTGSPVLRPGGHQLATSTKEGIVLWNLDPAAWERSACALAGRNLTRDEWHAYFPNRPTYRRTCSRWPPGP